MNNWLFIDKSDLTPEGKDWFQGARFKGTMERLDDWSWIRFLSICYTPVGKTILSRCPKLEWVMVRGTAYEKVDMNECRRRGVGVVEAIPTQSNCADYLVQHLDEEPFLFYGYGNIGRIAASRVVGDWPYVNRKTSEDRMLELVGRSRSILMSVSYVKGLHRPPVFGRRFFRALDDVTLVSVCRPGTTNNQELLSAVREGRIRKAIFDTPGKDCYEELMATGLVVDTKHTAWLTGMSRTDYLQRLRTCADALIRGKPIGVVLPRRK